MERHVPLVFFLIFLFYPAVFARAQGVNQEQRIQILLWAEKESYPGIDWDKETIDFENPPQAEESAENPYSIPVKRLKKIAPFFIEGMLYGWKVEYTPSDKARAVKEYLEFEPVQKLTDGELKSIQYKNSAFKDDRLYCRVEFDRSDFQMNLYKSWQTVTNPKVRGLGYGKLEDGFDGIQEACAQAMKNAVREYWRQHIKNKPKEISGRLLLCASPVIGVDAGRYRVMLDFFMETDRILNYETF